MKKNRDPIESLETEPYAYEFDQMMYLLHQLNQKREQTTPISISSHIHLHWPPSDIHSVCIGKPEDPLHRLRVNFWGLAGAQGPLPLSVTETLLKQLRQKDYAFADFLDIFNNRLLHLLHQSHKKARPTYDIQPPEHTLLGKTVCSLAGIAGPFLQKRHAFLDRSLLNYAGILWARPRSGEGLRCILRDYFQISVSSFHPQGRWKSMESSDRTRLGTQLHALGSQAALGGRVWDEIAYTRVALGPLSLDCYENFLPTGGYFAVLRDLCRYYVHHQSRTIVILRIQSGQVPPIQLKGTKALGWNTWLKGKSPHIRDTQTQLFIYS